MVSSGLELLLQAMQAKAVWQKQKGAGQVVEKT